MSTDRHEGERRYSGTAVARLVFSADVGDVPPRDRYAALSRFGDEAPRFSLTAEFLESLGESRWETLAMVDFLVDSAPHELLVRGAEFDLVEGNTVVAQGIVLISSRHVSSSSVRDAAFDAGPPRRREAV